MILLTNLWFNNAVCCKRFDISDKYYEYWTEGKKRTVDKKTTEAEEKKEDAIEDNPFIWKTKY
jgi:hypothetical protein